MAEPGDPTVPKASDPAVDHDDLIGFPSSAALQGRSRPVAPAAPQGVAPSEPDLFADEPAIDPFPTLNKPFSGPHGSAGMGAGERLGTRIGTPSQADPVAPVSPAPVPDWAIETPARPAPAGSRSPGHDLPGDVEGANSLYSVYALILFAVPTLGTSALIALLAVTGRSTPGHPVAASHFVFQRRTLWAGGVAALLGGILIAVGLGVFVLFIVAVWLILRGTSGILALKAGRPVRDPRGWFLA